MDRAKVCVLKHAGKVCFGRLLQGKKRRRLEAKVGEDFGRDLTDEALEREMTNEEVGGLLVFANFTQRDRTRAVAMRLLQLSFTSSFRRKLLDRSFAARRNTRSLLGACHNLSILPKIGAPFLECVLWGSFGSAVCTRALGFFFKYKKVLD